MRILARCGIVAALIAIVAIPAPGQSAGVTFTGTVLHSTVKARKPVITIVPATGQQQDAGLRDRINADPALKAALVRTGHDSDEVIAMTTGPNGAVTLYVAPRR